MERSDRGGTPLQILLLGGVALALLFGLLYYVRQLDVKGEGQVDLEEEGTKIDAAIVQDRVQDGVRFVRLEFTGAGGARVQARASWPEPWPGPPSVMIYFPRAVEDPSVVDELGPMAAEQGWGIVALPYPGKPGREWDGKADRQQLHFEDGKICAGLLDGLPGVGKNPLLTAGGGSLGAPVAIRLAAEPEVRGVLAIVTGSRPEAGEHDPARYAARVAPDPFYLIGAKRDEIFARDEVNALFQAAEEPRTLYWVDAPHRFPLDKIKNQISEYLEVLKRD